MVIIPKTLMDVDPLSAFVTTVIFLDVYSL
jgi:hypothetical protein